MTPNNSMHRELLGSIQDELPKRYSIRRRDSDGRYSIAKTCILQLIEGYELTAFLEHLKSGQHPDAFVSVNGGVRL
jgi:hypothetical protein